MAEVAHVRVCLPFHPMLRPTLALLTAACLCLTATVRAHDGGTQMATMANFFLKALTPEQRTKATFKFEDEERINWHFIPRERKGLPMKEMTPQQRLLAQALLNTGLGF